MLDDTATEAFGQPEVDRHLEGGAPLGEVLVELARGGVQSGRRPQHPRAHRPGKRGQDRVVVFDVVGNSDQADGGGGQQQGADRAVDGAVGNVEEFVGGGVALQPLMQSGQRRVVGMQFVENVGGHAVSSSG
jgi:hypothetical protein